MRLTDEGLKEGRAEFEAEGFSLPSYDRGRMRADTEENPVWVHFGGGNIFRAFHAKIADRLLSKGLMHGGIVVAEGYDEEILRKAYWPYDNLSVAVTLNPEGDLSKEVVGSVAESLPLDPEDESSFGKLKAIFESKSLQMATFTVTEKGYALYDATGKTLPFVQKDFVSGPSNPMSYLGKVASLMLARYNAGKGKIALVSTDNCSRNGEKLFMALDAYAKEWSSRGLAPKGFKDYVEDPSLVSFPWTMIDKITPRPDASVARALSEAGLEGMEPILTKKGTYVAPFVNAEGSEYLVIEDSFPNGRPPLEEAGVIFGTREAVSKTERMKVTACLNPLHTALAIYGCLLGYTKISDEMKDEDLSLMVGILGEKEDLPALEKGSLIEPRAFLREVIKRRLPNPYLPDTPQRIATDTSQKLPIRFGETIKSYLKNKDLDVDSLRIIPLVIAGWLRYLMAVDDNGDPFEPSQDPFLALGERAVASFRLGGKADHDEAKKRLAPFLSNETIFGTDLVRAGLSDRIVALFLKEIEGPQMVRKTLHEEVIKASKEGRI